MKLFLTGGTGFIGSHVLARALAAGHSVVALRRPGSRPKITLPTEPTWLEKPIDQLGAADLRGCDAVVHLASAGVSPQKASWPELLQWNVCASVALMQAAQMAGIRRIVVAGTFAEYGRSADRYEFIPADAPLLPTYAYAGSKAAAFAAAYSLAVEAGMELAYLRIFSAYGEGQFEGNFWPSLRAAAHSGRDFEMTAGEQIRDYVAVELVADAFLAAALRTDIVPGRPLVRNVGSGQPTTMRAFAEHWWREWKAPGHLLTGRLPYRANEVMRFVPDMQEEVGP
ncbi:MAG: NAD(P)-dependent oxidoreductase [Stagnimonas sp.]|nr:NAD(P)-dependent oxidoreductase [Stagnimonas sp.]